MQVLASQLHFLANRNAGLAIIETLDWPVNCIKIGGHVALLSGPTVYSLYCAKDVNANTVSMKLFTEHANACNTEMDNLKIENLKLMSENSHLKNENDNLKERVNNQGPVVQS